MNRTLFASLHTLFADPDCLDRDVLFAVLDDDHASNVLACLAPTGSLLQIAAALRRGWPWVCDGWERHTNALVAMITDPRCPSPSRMITTWSRIPSAVGVLRDRTDTLIAWAKQRLDPKWYDELAVLLGPSDAAVRVLVQSPFRLNIGATLRRWSMATNPTDPTAWQAMINADMRAALHQSADPSWAFPAWGWDGAVYSVDIFDKIVDDLVAGWSPDHPSLRGRIAWLEHHVDFYMHVGNLALVASIGRSDALAKTVCARLGHNPSAMDWIADNIPWDRLHPRIQTDIDETMQQASDYWKRTWACALGQIPVERDTTIDSHMLLWRIDPERWNDLDPSIRAVLVSGINLPPHCYGWGVHPDLVGQRVHLHEDLFRFWNPDVPPDDLRAWAYADVLHAQRDYHEARMLIALLMTLPPDRRARFEQIIDGRLGGRPKAPAQPPWDLAGWTALPAADRQTAIGTRLAVLWGDREPSPAVRFWRARNDGLATVALMVGEMLGLDDPTPLLAALLAQVLVLHEDTTDVGPSLPFPDDLDAARRAQIERLPLAPDAQAYAAWGLWLLARRADVGADLIALHPEVAVALAPILNADQQKAVAVSPVAQGWDSMTVMHWAAACAPAQEQPMHPIQRRIL